MKPLVPSEDYEGACLAYWLEDNHYRFSHLAQNTFTRSFAIKRKLQRAGVRPGIPDYLICLKNGGILFIELKRIKGGKLSPEQKEWLAALNNAGAFARVAKGFEEAKQIVLECEKKGAKVDV